MHIHRMKRWLGIILVGMIASATGTSFAGTSQKLNLENLISDRAMRIIGKVDPDAVIQSKVILKNVTSSLPGVWMNAKVVPLTQEGELGSHTKSALCVGRTYFRHTLLYAGRADAGRRRQHREACARRTEQAYLPR